MSYISVVVLPSLKKFVHTHSFSKYISDEMHVAMGTVHNLTSPAVSSS
jgi:hypothetical protein